MTVNARVYVQLASNYTRLRIYFPVSFIKRASSASILFVKVALAKQKASACGARLIKCCKMVAALIEMNKLLLSHLTEVIGSLSSFSHASGSFLPSS